MNNKYIRLNFIVSLVNKEDIVLDIGTDHGLVPILLQNKNINSDASDISHNPLKKAKFNIEKKGYKNKINLYLSDGLLNVPNYKKYTKIIIAGMGGKNISNILNQKKIKSTLILHPTNNEELVRKTLIKNKFKIIDEYLIKENNVYNLIINSEKRKLKFIWFISKKYIYFGNKFWKNNNADIDIFLDNKITHLKKIYLFKKEREIKKQISYIKQIKKWREKQ